MRRLHITKHAKERMAQRLNGTNLRVLAEHVHQNCIRREEIPPGPLRRLSHEVEAEFWRAKRERRSGW